MHSRILLLTTLAASLMTTSAAHAETASEIMNRFEKKKAEALTAYLEANPEAADRAEALSYLVNAQMILGNQEEIAPLLAKRYDALDKGPDANLGDLMGNVVQPLIKVYIDSGDKEKAKAFITQVETDTKSHPMAGQIQRFLEQMAGELNTPSKGDVLEIAFTDINGKEFDLAKLKDKVVLVDFWATWCGPCVAEMPNVIAAYEKYHDKGFEVVGISLDQDKDSLVKFIEDKNMPWPQYFDGKGWQNEIAGRYGIGSIPATFLVGKDGKIAASDLRGGALEAMLDELLK